jgi:hypothetical protein
MLNADEVEKRERSVRGYFNKNIEVAVRPVVAANPRAEDGELVTPSALSASALSWIVAMISARVIEEIRSVVQTSLTATMSRCYASVWR